MSSSNATGAGSVVDRLQQALTQTPGPVATWLYAEVEALLSDVPFRVAALRALEPKRESPSTRLLTPQEAADLLRESVRWIRRHTQELPHQRHGRHVRFPEKALLKWAEARQR